MSSIFISHDAEQDLLSIWSYTSKKWDNARADRYLRKIATCLNKIEEGKTRLKKLPDRDSHIQYVHCEHHYIFILMETKPTVIAILHEKMDLLAKLKNRLT